MNILTRLLEKKLFPLIIVSFLTVITLGTSVMGLNKVAANLNPNQTQVLGSSSQDVNSTENSEQSEARADIEKQTPTNSPTPTRPNSLLPLKKATSTPTPTKAQLMVTSQNNTNTQGGCIITIFGKQYNVDSLINSHPGGNVFVCGTDQTALYQSAHGTSVSRLARYLVTAGSSVSGSGSTSTGVSSSQSSNGKIEREDDERENEFEDD